MPLVARALPHRSGTGADQMEQDAALLLRVATEPDGLIMRTYSWSHPTLSLGRSEPYPEGWDRDAIDRRGVEVVRRPTGGDAVFHVDETAFAVASSLPGPLRLSPRAFSERVAEGVAASIRDLGLRAVRIGRDRPMRASTPGAYPCFARPARDEVRVGAFKVAGIAARITRGGALAHGSIPRTGRFREIAGFRTTGDTDGPILARHARSLEELLRAAVDEAAYRDRLIARLAEAFGADVDWGEAPARRGIA